MRVHPESRFLNGYGNPIPRQFISGHPSSEGCGISDRRSNCHNQISLFLRPGDQRFGCACLDVHVLSPLVKPLLAAMRGRLDRSSIRAPGGVLQFQRLRGGEAAWFRGDAPEAGAPEP